MTSHHAIQQTQTHTLRRNVAGQDGHNRRAGTANMMSLSFTRCFSISSSLSSSDNSTSNLPSISSVLISFLTQHQHSTLLSIGRYLSIQRTDMFKQKNVATVKAKPQKLRNAELFFRNVRKAEKQNCRSDASTRK